MAKFYVQSFGWVYLVIVLDWYSKKIVGYKLNIRSKADDWIVALNMAVDNNCPLGSREYELHLMSDNGSQPTSEKYENAVRRLSDYLASNLLQTVIPILKETLILKDLSERSKKK